VQTSTINSWSMMKLHLVQRDIFSHKYDVIDSQSASLISSSSKSILVYLLLIDWKESSCLMNQQFKIENHENELLKLFKDRAHHWHDAHASSQSSRTDEKHHWCDVDE